MRIHHFTLPALNPEHVAQTLAELLGARVLPMPHPAGAFFVYGGDPDGTLLEVWPAQIRAESGDLALTHQPLPAGWPHHAYITSDACDPEKVVATFEREGWRVERAHNGPPHAGFTLIRGWIENHSQIEIGSTDMRLQYERAALTLNALGEAGDLNPKVTGALKAGEGR